MIVAFREKGWLDRKTDYRMWDHLCRAFNQDFELIDDWHEVKPRGPVVVLDQAGTGTLRDFEHIEECTYVFGRTGLNDLPGLIPHAASLRIETPNPISLFGIEAAAIVLADRNLKHGD